MGIVQARMGSERLPEKVMKSLEGKPMIEYVLNRLSRSHYLDQVVLATSVNEENDPLFEFVEQLGFPVFRGSEEDVMGRYIAAAKEYGADYVVRVTGDCPLIDPMIVDYVISYYKINDFDFVKLDVPDTFIRGFDTEICSLKILEDAYEKAKREGDTKYLEHVTYYLYTHPEEYRIGTVLGESLHRRPYRLCVDTKEDFRLLEEIYRHFGRIDVEAKEVIAFLDEHPEIAMINREIQQRI